MDHINRSAVSVSLHSFCVCVCVELYVGHKLAGKSLIPAKWSRLVPACSGRTRLSGPPRDGLVRLISGITMGWGDLRGPQGATDGTVTPPTCRR